MQMKNFSRTVCMKNVSYKDHEEDRPTPTREGELRTSYGWCDGLDTLYVDL